MRSRAHCFARGSFSTVSPRLVLHVPLSPLLCCSLVDFRRSLRRVPSRCATMRSLCRATVRHLVFFCPLTLSPTLRCPVPTRVLHVQLRDLQGQRAQVPGVPADVGHDQHAGALWQLHLPKLFQKEVGQEDGLIFSPLSSAKSFHMYSTSLPWPYL